MSPEVTSNKLIEFPRRSARAVYEWSARTYLPWEGISLIFGSGAITTYLGIAYAHMQNGVGFIEHTTADPFAIPAIAGLVESTAGMLVFDTIVPADKKIPMSTMGMAAGKVLLRWTKQEIPTVELQELPI